MPGRVRTLAAADEAEAVEALAAAFRDNPLNVAVVGDDPQRRLRSNRAGMAQLVPNVRQRGTVLSTRNPAGLGVLLANPPGSYPLGPPGLRSQLRALLAQGPRVALRWQQVFDHMHGVHPLEPHWYLATLGIDPRAQGNGLGSALLAALLRRADADRLPCWLETDRAGNLPFYERAGFRTQRESRIFDIPIWHMQRDPRPSDPVAGPREGTPTPL
jgi:ribosomal protein S18 acetylase RimI-like enzyme